MKKLNLLTIAVLVLSGMMMARPVAAATAAGFTVDCTGAFGLGDVPAHGNYSWAVHFFDPRVGNAPVGWQGTVSGGESGALFNPAIYWPVTPTQGTGPTDSYYWWWVWDSANPFSGTLLASSEGHFNCEPPPPPPPPLEGCTPGYWKQPQHFDSWVGYAPADSFEAVFGRDVPGNPTLLDALGANSGGLNALMRHATAALLNASNPIVDPDPAIDTTAEVIAAFQAAFDSGSYEATKNMFEASNEAGCPLD